MRALSTALKAAITAQETGEALLPLLTISHPDLAVPLRLVRNQVDVTSRGETYTAFAFDVTLPDDVDDHPPRASLVIDNISLELVDLMRSLREPPEMLLELVFAGTPDTVEASWQAFLLDQPSWDAKTIEASLVLEETLLEEVPFHAFTPGFFPGVFKAL